jgi:hypothetical protein
LRFASIAMASSREDSHLQGKHHAGRTRKRGQRLASPSALSIISGNQLPEHALDPAPGRVLYSCRAAGDTKSAYLPIARVVRAGRGSGGGRLVSRRVQR